MATNSATRRSRATADQLKQMVDFMQENPGLAGGSFQKLHGKVECEKKWNKMAGLLNSAGGAVKSVDQWHTVWRDLKSRTSIKMRERKKQQARTGNKPISQEPITELERRVIAIIGSDYIDGHESVFEYVSMDEDLQMRLENDDEDSILDVRSSSSTPVKANELRCKTPQRVLKRKYVEDDSDTLAKFLEITNKQADAIKMLAESKDAIVESNKMMAEAIKTMGEGLIAVGNAFNNLSNLTFRLKNEHNNCCSLDDNNS